MAKPKGVHLVGSVPFDSGATMFTKSCASLPGRLATIPDGETQVRNNFVGWQKFCFPKEIDGQYAHGSMFDDLLPPDTTYPKDLEHMPPTQYDEKAAQSYRTFKELQSNGTIPAGVRFQVCLPGPSNVVYAHIIPPFRAKAYPPYKKQFLHDVARIPELIPKQDLAIQIDLAGEVAFLETVRGNLDHPFFRPHWSENVEEIILADLLELSKLIPSEIPLGYHLCYGDIEHQHFIQPQNSGLLVELANRLVAQLKPYRPVSYIHMPVPKDRTDAAYYEPLKQLDIGDAKLFLGLVHAHDEAGTVERINTANAVYGSPFGVATECGMGRTPLDDIDSIFAISKAVSEPI